MLTASHERLNLVSQPATWLKRGRILLSWGHGFTRSRSFSAKSSSQIPYRLIPQRNMLRPQRLKNGTIESSEGLVPPAGKCIRCAFTAWAGGIVGYVTAADKPSSRPRPHSLPGTWKTSEGR